MIAKNMHEIVSWYEWDREVAESSGIVTRRIAFIQGIRNIGGARHRL